MYGVVALSRSQLCGSRGGAMHLLCGSERHGVGVSRNAAHISRGTEITAALPYKSLPTSHTNHCSRCGVRGRARGSPMSQQASRSPAWWRSASMSGAAHRTAASVPLTRAATTVSGRSLFQRAVWRRSLSPQSTTHYSAAVRTGVLSCCDGQGPAVHWDKLAASSRH